MHTARRNLTRMTLLLVLLAPSIAPAIDDAQNDAINQLGELNGMALKCKFYDETTRMKTAMVATVPKVRALGALFEDATNTGFMRAIEGRQPCPANAEFTERVSAGIERLKQAFAK